MKTPARASRGAGLEGGSIMYEPSRNLFSFHIAGFQHHDGALVLGKLKAGDTLELVPERDNPYDAEAIAVKFHGAMLGYVPADSVGPLSTLFFTDMALPSSAACSRSHPSAAPGIRFALPCSCAMRDKMTHGPFEPFGGARDASNAHRIG